LGGFWHGAKEWPQLRGRAAEIRHFGKVLLWIWCKHMRHGNHQDVQIKLALENNIEMENILRATSGRFKVPDIEAGKFEKHAQNLVALTSALHLHFKAKNLKMFPFTIKSHYLLHLAARVRFFHPYLGWCYAGEDFLHKQKILLRSCVKGAPHMKATRNALEKYSFGLYHRLAQDPQWS